MGVADTVDIMKDNEGQKRKLERGDLAWHKFPSLRAPLSRIYTMVAGNIFGREREEEGKRGGQTGV